VRCPDIVNAFEQSDQRACHEFLKSDRLSTPNIKISLLEELPGARQFINEMRAHNMVLRSKLQHIGDMAI
jgi:hypothetical protein